MIAQYTIQVVNKQMLTGVEENIARPWITEYNKNIY